MPELVSYCQVIMGNLWSAESLLNIPSTIESSAGQTKEDLVKAAGESMLHLHRQYPRATSFAYTFRLEKEYWGLLQHGPGMTVSKSFPIGGVIDKVGSGDCFMAGLIYGLYHQISPAETINYAAAAAWGKLQELGDATRQTVDQVKARI
jgi:2-dehydro-3-deoxygluconokinase